MEVMNNTKSKEDPSRWSVINSRHEIFTEPSSGRRLTIEGEPGFGKSTLLLQYSYDWCTSSIESPLKDIDIFILIRLREVVDAPTISDAIRMMLPDDFSLTAKDIEAIITSGNWTVVLALDGYDEYSGMEGCSKDVTRLIQGRMLTACIVITTTRPSCLPKLLNPNMKLFRLTGFDREMQEEYLDKSVTFNAAAKGAKEAIMRKLEENVVLADICQVPFFFATFTHMACTSSNGMQLNSVTRYFSFMLACFFSHLENKELLGNRMPVHAVLEEDPNQRLAVAKLAFDGLIEQEQKLLWSQRNLEKYMGSSCYNRYVKAGVLVEEEHRIFQAIPGSHADDKIVITTYARFFHKTIQEYYAAYHIAHLAENENAEVVKNTMSKFKLGDLQYVLRFACGLRPTAARLVQDYLGGLGEIGRMLSVLCLMEQQQGDIDKKVAELCRDRIRISIEESRILQRSKLQLLCTASHRNVSITFESIKLDLKVVTYAQLNPLRRCFSSSLFYRVSGQGYITSLIRLH
ncbi:NLR family CARD domain-containing protein 4 [Holothuria leucospilota]|uniref:NLR family CARD domain-containing protein 4 n=1 Tax=Holothuria leucospilota TaxID=206669 RepID=A0A9Q1B9U6_HOLLE|nr:NLR family CARD domain-containing protein 4 [Holothuria leucospilota]